MRMFRLSTLGFLMLVSAFGSLSWGEDIRIVRDDFGIPHIFAETDEGVSFGFGYAQAEDRLDQLFQNYRLAAGLMSEAFGKDYFEHDCRQHMWRHMEVSKAKYDTISEKSRRCIEAYHDGIRAYMKEHPDEVPAYAMDLEPWMVVCLSRSIIWGWPEGDAADDLKEGGIQPDPIEYRGSNQWLIAPDRTEAGVPLALIDPHLSWYGPFRFYEGRLYGDEIKVSGVSILGACLPSLGHSQWCSVAMTTGSGDTADVFEEKINTDNPLQYEVDGQWRDMTVRKEVVRVRKEDGTFDEQEVEFAYTHHGPVVSRKGEKAYTMALPYMEDIGLTDQVYAMMTAKNLEEMKEALSHLGLMGQNVMIGTVDGDIYYQRTGKVPIRAEGVDPSRPIPGHLSKNDWKGIHSAEDLVQVTNPEGGYMQNCNVSPFGMMKNSPMRLKDYPPYVYGTTEIPPHQRAAMVVEILDADDSVSVEEAIDLAANCEVFGAENWQARLKKAFEGTSPTGKEEAALLKLILDWDRKSHEDSTGAIAYMVWKNEIPEEARKGDRMGDPPADSLTDEQVRAALSDAAKKLMKDFGKLEVPYGEVYRVGREGGEKTWPVGGGNPTDGMATPRAIGFKKQEDGTFLGNRGITSSQVVLLTKPPQSWTVLPLGQSDRKDSGHWDDQAEKLMSTRKMKPTFFMDNEGLEKHKESEKTVKYTH
jgi:acyl-homoserine lactone acylase PvdQ